MKKIDVFECSSFKSIHYSIYWMLENKLYIFQLPRCCACNESRSNNNFMKHEKNGSMEAELRSLTQQLFNLITFLCIETHFDGGGIRWQAVYLFLYLFNSVFFFVFFVFWNSNNLPMAIVLSSIDRYFWQQMVSKSILILIKEPSSKENLNLLRKNLPSLVWISAILYIRTLELNTN